MRKSGKMFCDKPDLAWRPKQSQPRMDERVRRPARKRWQIVLVAPEW
jgi:hypothetical protein